MARSRASNIFVWIILGLLFVGLIGFGATGLGGNVRSLGTVGSKEIPISSYVQGLNGQARALEAQVGEAVSFAQLQAFGIDRQVLSEIVAQKLLENEAAQLGVSVGDLRVGQQIQSIDAFRGPDGTINRVQYRDALERIGVTEDEFQQSIRDEISGSLLQVAVVSGTPASETYVDTLMGWVGERRDFSWVALDAASLTEALAAPDATELEAYYTANIDDFTTPEQRVISYAWRTPDMMIDAIEIDEDVLRGLYDDRIGEFVQPERRLVERLIFPDSAAAQDALARITGGEIDFETAVAERGIDLSLTDMGDVTEGDLGEAGAGVFAAGVGETVGPLPTDLGPALFRVNAILAAQERSFEDARDDLGAELAAERARRMLDDELETLNDFIAGGATPELLAQETDLVLGEIAWDDSVTDGIAAYDGFRVAAEALQDGALPALIRLEDGGIVVLELTGTIDPQVRPIEEVMGAVIAGWEAQATTEALRSQATEIAEALGAGRTFAAFDLTPTQEADRLRRGFVLGTPPTFLTEVFELERGATAVIDGPDATVIIVRVDDIKGPDLADPQIDEMRQTLEQSAQAGISQDLMRVVSESIRQSTDISINEGALTAIHSQLAGGGGHGG